MPAVTPNEEACFQVSKNMTNLLHHKPKLRQDDGAVGWKELLVQFLNFLHRTPINKDSVERETIQTCKVMRKFQTGGSDCIHHVGPSWNCRSIAGAGLLAGGTIGRRGR